MTQTWGVLRELAIHRQGSSPSLTGREKKLYDHFRYTWFRLCQGGEPNDRCSQIDYLIIMTDTAAGIHDNGIEFLKRFVPDIIRTMPTEEAEKIGKIWASFIVDRRFEPSQYPIFREAVMKACIATQRPPEEMDDSDMPPLELHHLHHLEQMRMRT